MPKQPKKAPERKQPELHALNVKKLDVRKLRPHPDNPNQHPEAQVDGLGAAFGEFGITSIVVVDEGGFILAGEGRWRAAVKAKIRQVVGIQIAGWTDAKKRAFMLSDNKLATLSQFDDARLRLNIEAIQMADFNLGFTGFDNAEIGRLLAGVQPPEQFQAYGADLETEQECPRCGYKWSGKTGSDADDD